MKQLLRAAHYNGQNWYDVLPLAEMAINNAPLPNSNYSAYYLNYGFHPCCEADLFNFNAPTNDVMENADDFISRMQQNWRAAYHLMQELREAGREQANKHRKQHEIAVGDRVLVSLKKHDAASLSNLPRGPLSHHFAGPFTVLKKIANNAFQLELPRKALSAKVHDVFNVAQLKKYHSATPRMDNLEDAQEQIQEWQEAPLVEIADPGDEEEDLEQDDLDRVLHQQIPQPQQPQPVAPIVNLYWRTALPEIPYSDNIARVWRESPWKKQTLMQTFTPNPSQ